MRWAQQPPQDWSQSTGRQHRPPLTSKHLRTFLPNCRIHCCFPCVFHVFSIMLIYFDGLLFFQRLFLVTVTFLALLQRHPSEDCQKCQAMWLLKNTYLDGHPGNCRSQTQIGDRNAQKNMVFWHHGKVNRATAIEAE